MNWQDRRVFLHRPYRLQRLLARPLAHPAQRSRSRLLARPRHHPKPFQRGPASLPCSQPTPEPTSGTPPSSSNHSRTSPPRSSFTSPPSPSSAFPTPTPSPPTKPTSSAPRACSTPSAVPRPSGPSSSSPPTRSTPTRKPTSPFTESDPLGGFDPYSSSKACAEIATAAWRNSFFPPAQHAQHGVAIATAPRRQRHRRRRLVLRPPHPRSHPRLPLGQAVPIRSPHAIRPWQHVLESLQGYLLLADKLLGPEAPAFSRAFNFGPSEADAKPVDWIAQRLTETWGEQASWYLDQSPQPHEASYLRLDATPRPTRPPMAPSPAAPASARLPRPLV